MLGLTMTHSCLSESIADAAELHPPLAYPSDRRCSSGTCIRGSPFRPPTTSLSRARTRTRETEGRPPHPTPLAIVRVTGPGRGAL